MWFTDLKEGFILELPTPFENIKSFHIFPTPLVKRWKLCYPTPDMAGMRSGKRKLLFNCFLFLVMDVHVRTSHPIHDVYMHDVGKTHRKKANYYLIVSFPPTCTSTTLGIGWLIPTWYIHCRKKVSLSTPTLRHRRRPYCPASLILTLKNVSRYPHFRVVSKMWLFRSLALKTLLLERIMLIVLFCFVFSSVLVVLFPLY